MEDHAELRAAYEAAREFLDGVGDRAVGPPVDIEALQASFDGPLPRDGDEPATVVDDLVAAVEPGLVASTGPRYFGFVTGGALTAAVAAEWLASAWDQNVALQVMSPALAAAEGAAARWLLETLDLPPQASVGFVTGATMANAVGLAAGRHRVLADVGWDVEEEGLQGAPALQLVCGAEVHASLLNAAQYLGMGRGKWRQVDTDAEGRMRPDHLREVLTGCVGPTLVACQAGNVNSGAIDPLEEIGALCSDHGAWLHVDGAFGLWVRASERLRHLAAGAEHAHSFATDAHKWLNVPYDSGIAIVADPVAHRAAMSIGASYLIPGDGRDGMDWVPEASRRGRGLAIYAALRQLGRRGLTELVERCCRLASRFADHMRAMDGVVVLNDVVLNQVVLGFEPPSGEDPQRFRDRLAAAIHRDGTCWVGGTIWRDQPALRVSVSNWRTRDDDIDRSARAIIAAYQRCQSGT